MKDSKIGQLSSVLERMGVFCPVLLPAHTKNLQDVSNNHPGHSELCKNLVCYQKLYKTLQVLASLFMDKMEIEFQINTRVGVCKFYLQHAGLLEIRDQQQMTCHT